MINLNKLDKRERLATPSTSMQQWQCTQAGKQVFIFVIHMINYTYNLFPPFLQYASDQETRKAWQRVLTSSAQLSLYVQVLSWVINLNKVDRGEWD